MLNNAIKNDKKFATENKEQRKFTTFDEKLVEFLQEKGIKYVKKFKGREDYGYDYGIITNIRDLLYEYRNSKRTEVVINTEEQKQAKFEKMLANFLKDSLERRKGFVKEHTKTETQERKTENSKRRKIALAKRNKRRAENGNDQ